MINNRVNEMNEWMKRNEKEWNVMNEIDSFSLTNGSKDPYQNRNEQTKDWVYDKWDWREDD